ncbi:hypothetical protein K461DRAFT_301483 [Myriangium duriaei CBS 260.36]|uniref:Uncharacterized protein n=1 Tax=Myriangium duriaei CBS 260.36 TaxID=1168546 RepID=A0A9P4IUT7_9PEZI|nr:hypothetical protein K461DRAFT_301483 [Myriangium duriaei CBS 260.36]
MVSSNTPTFTYVIMYKVNPVMIKWFIVHHWHNSATAQNDASRFRHSLSVLDHFDTCPKFFVTSIDLFQWPLNRSDEAHHPQDEGPNIMSCSLGRDGKKKEEILANTSKDPFFNSEDPVFMTFRPLQPQCPAGGVLVSYAAILVPQAAPHLGVRYVFAELREVKVPKSESRTRCIPLLRVRNPLYSRRREPAAAAVLIEYEIGDNYATRNGMM